MIINIKEDLQKRIRNWNLDSVVKNMTTKEEHYNSLVHEKYTCVKEQDLLLNGIAALIEEKVLPESAFDPDFIEYLSYRKECKLETYNNKIYISYDEGENFTTFFLTTENQNITWKECRDQGIKVGTKTIDAGSDYVKLNGTELFTANKENVKITDKVEYMGRYFMEYTPEPEPTVEKYIRISFDGGENFENCMLCNLVADDIDWELAISKGLTIDNNELLIADDIIMYMDRMLEYSDGDPVYKNDMIEIGGKYILG